MHASRRIVPGSPEGETIEVVAPLLATRRRKTWVRTSLSALELKHVLDEPSTETKVRIPAPH